MTSYRHPREVRFAAHVGFWRDELAGREARALTFDDISTRSRIHLTGSKRLRRIESSLLCVVSDVFPYDSGSTNAIPNPLRISMQKPAHVVVKGLLVAGALALACVPMPAQRISVDTVRNGHFPEALRGRMDGRPDKSIHRLSPADIHDSAAANVAKPGAAPQPIVSPFFRKSSRSGSVNYGFLVGPNP